MLRYDRQTKPGLVALYDIRPGNGVGLFLQPPSPHGANAGTNTHSDDKHDDDGISCSIIHMHCKAEA